MNKIIMFFSLIGEGIKNAFVSVFVGSILSTLIFYLIGLREMIEVYDAATFVFLSLFFLFFAVLAIAPYFVAGVIAEVFRLPSWGVVIMAIVAIVWHSYISIGIYSVGDGFSTQDYFLVLMNILPVFAVFLFVSLYERNDSQKPAA
jgi:hypothetical protein